MGLCDKVREAESISDPIRKVFHNTAMPMPAGDGIPIWGRGAAGLHL